MPRNQTATTAILSEIGDRWISRHDLLKKLSERYSGVLVSDALRRLLSTGTLARRLDAVPDSETKGIRTAYLRPSYARRCSQHEAARLVILKGI